MLYESSSLAVAVLERFRVQPDGHAPPDRTDQRVAGRESVMRNITTSIAVGLAFSSGSSRSV